MYAKLSMILKIKAIDVYGTQSNRKKNREDRFEKDRSTRATCGPRIHHVSPILPRVPKIGWMDRHTPVDPPNPNSTVHGTVHGTDPILKFMRNSTSSAHPPILQIPDGRLHKLFRSIALSNTLFLSVALPSLPCQKNQNDSSLQKRT